MKKNIAIFKNCFWIGADDKACQSPIISRTFTINSNIISANLSITGLGYFEAHINDRAVTDYRFLPVASDYEPRKFTEFMYPLNDTTTTRVYYYDFDVTELLNKGDNTFNIQLANGWYRQTERIIEGPVSYGDTLKAIYKLKIMTTDGERIICSDGSETWIASPITYNNIFHGEVIDLTVPADFPKPVKILSNPDSLISPTMGTPDKVIRTIKPVYLGEQNGKAVFDAGENISAVVRLWTSAPFGERITLQFAENINDDLSLNHDSVYTRAITPSGKHQIMRDEFITDGQVRCFEPRFVWHAFRYFEVEGSFDKVEVLEIHSDTPVNSTFHTGHEGMQFLYDAFLRTQLSNMHGSFPSDCPHRERLGYTGDGQICAEAAMLMLDCKAFYEKWIQDILDCQDIKTGHIQHTAPFMGGGGGPGGWGSAVIFVPYAYYKHYGDVHILEKSYSAMTRWIDYLETRCEDDLVVKQSEKGWCLGEWCPPGEILIPEIFVNSCFFVKNLLLLEEISRIIGKSEDSERFFKLRNKTENSIRRHYLDPSSGTFAGGIQGADAFAVWCGLAGEETVQKLAEKYDALGHFDTGVFGTNYLLEVLFMYGYGATAIKLLSSKEQGSFLYMKRNGATTIWEKWQNGFHVSNSHPMFGGSARHLFTGVLGIRQREGSAGFEDIIIAPCVTSDIKNVTGSITSPRGIITVAIDNTGDNPQITWQAPEGVLVTFKEPCR